MSTSTYGVPAFLYRIFWGLISSGVYVYMYISMKVYNYTGFMLYMGPYIYMYAYTNYPIYMSHIYVHI